MAGRRRFLTNLVSLTSARMAVRVANTVATVVIARSLGTSGYGVYAAGFAFASLASVFTDVGVAQVLLRAGARRHARLSAYFGNALLVKGVLVVVVYGGMLLASRLLHHPPDLFLAIAVLGLAAMTTAGQQVPFSLFMAVEEMHLLAIPQAATSLLALAGTVAVALSGGGLVAFAWVQVAAVVLPLPFILIRAVRLVPPRPEPGRIAGMLREGVSFGLGGIFYLVNLRVDVVVMTSFLAASVVGVYAAAYKIVSTIYFLPAIVSAVVIPRLFRYSTEDTDRHRRVAQTVLRYQSLLGGLIAGGLFLASGPAIRLLYGMRFAGAAPLLRLLCWLLVVQTMSYPLGDALTTVDRNGQRVTVTGVAASLNLGLNLLVIPRFGPAGAALVTLGTEMLTLLAFVVLVRRHLPGFRVFAALGAQTAAVGAGIVAGALVLHWQPAVGWIEALAAVAVLTGVTAVGLLVLGFFGEAERRWIRARVQRG